MLPLLDDSPGTDPTRVRDTLLELHPRDSANCPDCTDCRTGTMVDMDGADAIDRIILREAARHGTGAPGRTVVLDDLTGSLVAGLAPELGPASELGPLRVHCDSLTAERQARASAERMGVEVDIQPTLSPSVLTGAELVLLRLPKSLAALDEIAALAASVVNPDVLLIAGGRVRHMSRGMNAVLSQHFTTVSASLGQQKSRVLFATAPRADPASITYPRSTWQEDLALTVCAHGAAFAGRSLDLGTRFLLSFFDQMPTSAHSVIDLGCGTGILAAVLARRLPAAQVLALDDSAAACGSAAATAAANGVSAQVRVERRHALEGVADSSVDLIVCNPPFHRGTTRDSSVALELFAGAGRVLRPGGELWTVFNSHLPYLTALRRTVGSTKVIGQDRSYVVARSIPARR